MAVSRVDKVLVDFVGHHKDAVAQADFRHVRQFLPCPDPSHRVVGAAEEEQPHPVLRDFPFDILEVDVVLGSVEEQFAGHGPALVFRMAALKP